MSSRRLVLVVNSTSIREHVVVAALLGPALGDELLREAIPAVLGCRIVVVAVGHGEAPCRSSASRSIPSATMHMLAQQVA